jgi:hypothetical protein
MNKKVTINVPLALQELILTSNELINQIKLQCEQKIESANAEMMQILQLNPAAGWKLDVSTMTYIRELPPEPADSGE